MGMMEKMNILSFQILDEIKELKEKNTINTNTNTINNNIDTISQTYSQKNIKQNINTNTPNKIKRQYLNNSCLSYDYLKDQRERDQKDSKDFIYDLNVINETKRELISSTIKKNNNNIINNNTIINNPQSKEPKNYTDYYKTNNNFNFPKFNLLENKYENPQIQKNSNDFYKYKYQLDNLNLNQNIKLNNLNNLNNFDNETTSNNSGSLSNYVNVTKSKSKSRKLSNSKTSNNFYQNYNQNQNKNNSKNNSFYTNKISNINNYNLNDNENDNENYDDLNNLNDIYNNDNNNNDESIHLSSNDIKINLLRNNLNEKKHENSNSNFNFNLNTYNTHNNNNIKDKNKDNKNKIYETLPSFFKNEKLFSSFEIRDRVIKKISTSNEFGYFGIRSRDPMEMECLDKKYYFSIYIQNTNKSNIFIGITSDNRMGISGGFHKTHNSLMYNLSNCDAYDRNSVIMGNIARKGRTGDIYTFYVDFEFKFMKLFLNGNEINHNNIKIYSNETNFYPCLDIKDADDCVGFVDRIILNFRNKGF
jgi:hypothetical protein